MLNPSTNVQILFGSDFFPECITQKYDDYLFHLNGPIKTIKGILIESIQSVDVPGITIPQLQVPNLPNTGSNPSATWDPNFFPHSTMNTSYEGHEPWLNAIENQLVNITFRLNLLNWMYMYELMYSRYQRRNRVNQFNMSLIFKDAADIPMIKMEFDRCWIEILPRLEVVLNQAFNEQKTIDVSIRFNKLDITFAVPEFKKVDLKLSNNNG